MKRLATIILLTYSVVGHAQDAVIYSKGVGTEVKVKGTSNGGIFTDKGNFNFTDIDSVVTENERLRMDIDMKMNAKPVEVMTYKSANSLYIDGLPFDETGKLIFSDVVTVDGLTAKQLHLNARQFFVNMFKSANDVIQLDDKEAAVVVGKGFSPIYINVVSVSNKYSLYYTIKIQCRDGRYKYSIEDIYNHTPPSQYSKSMDTPIEHWFSKQSYFKNNGKPRDINSQYRDEVLRVANSLIAQIKEQMASTSISAGDDW